MDPKEIEKNLDELLNGKKPVKTPKPFTMEEQILIVNTFQEIVIRMEVAVEAGYFSPSQGEIVRVALATMADVSCSDAVKLLNEELS